MFDWFKGKSPKNTKQFGAYNFYIKSEPQSLDSSTTLSLTAYSNIFHTATIPCIYRWSIIRNGQTFQRPQFKGSSFRCQPSDVGAIVQAEVTSTDNQYAGTAILQFGPVKVDMNLRKQIENALSCGHQVRTVHVTNGVQERECCIFLTQNGLKIKHLYSQAIFCCEYSIFEPKIFCTSADSFRISFHFDSKYQIELKKIHNKLFQDLTRSITNSTAFLNHDVKKGQSNFLQIKFPNKNSRDVFIFVYKAMSTAKQLKSSIVLKKLEGKDTTNQTAFDYLLQIQNLKKDMSKIQKDLQISNQQKLRYIDQVQKLRKQKDQILSYYSKNFMNFDCRNHSLDDSSILSSSIRRDQAAHIIYRNLQNQNNHLNSRIEALTKQIDLIRFKPVKLHSTRQSNQIQNQNGSMNANFMLNASDKLKQPHIALQQTQSSPFSKKKGHDESVQMMNILDDLTTSRISYVSTIRQSEDSSSILEQKQKEKNQLQLRLEKSFQKIQYLQRQLKQVKQILGAKKDTMSKSMIYPIDNNFNDSRLNLSRVVDADQRTLHEKEREKLLREIQKLQKHNHDLAIQNKKLSEAFFQTNQISRHQQSISRTNSLSEVNLSTSSVSFDKKQQTVGLSEHQALIFKRQNQFLTNQNFKLAKACQKYMNEAKQAGKLRMQVIKLREEVSQKKYF